MAVEGLLTPEPGAKRNLRRVAHSRLA